MKQFASFYKPFIFYSKRIKFQYFDRQIKKKKNSNFLNVNVNLRKMNHLVQKNMKVLYI